MDALISAFFPNADTIKVIELAGCKSVILAWAYNDINCINFLKVGL